jgi:hypothetical protein
MKTDADESIVLDDEDGTPTLSVWKIQSIYHDEESKGNVVPKATYLRHCSH